MKRLLILSLFAAGCHAQTSTLTLLTSLMPLLKCSSATPANPQLLTFNGTTVVCVAMPTLALPAFVDGETPAGAINGTNAVFTLTNTPAASSLVLYRNGIRLCSGTCGGILADYSVSGNTITFGAASLPQSGDILLADYRH